MEVEGKILDSFIRWRWLLTYLDILLSVAIGLGNVYFRFDAKNWDLLVLSVRW